MKELRGELFDQPCELTVITTNGFVKQSGHAVMGRGCAKQAATKYPLLPRLLGYAIQEYGNSVHTFDMPDGKTLASFPVKPEKTVCLRDKSNVVGHMKDKFEEGQEVPGWASVAVISMIIQSARELVVIADKNDWTYIVLPRPGCGAGDLDWNSTVKPALTGILDNRFSVITF